MSIKSLLLTTAVAVSFALSGAAIAAEDAKAEPAKADEKVDTTAKKHHKKHRKGHHNKKHHHAEEKTGHDKDDIGHDGDLAGAMHGKGKMHHHKAPEAKKDDAAKPEMTQDAQGGNKKDKK